MSEKDRARHHRRRVLIYRPSPSDSPITHPVQQNDTRPAKHQVPRGLVASPVERETRRLLSVQLSDIAQEAEQLHMKTPPDNRTSLTDDCAVCSRLSPENPCDHPDASVLTHSSTKDYHEPPTLSPPKVPRWGLVPLFHSVRSKLESFAEIFLTPIKSRREPQESENSVQQGEPEQLLDQGQNVGLPTDEVYTEDGGSRTPVCSALDLLSDGEGTEEDKPVTPTFQLDISRPPLQRCRSVPSLPLTPHVRRHSLDTMEKRSESCSGRRRQRRHSLGTVDECRSQSPMFFTCLRKEKHPFLLWQGSVPQHTHGSIHIERSPPSLCSDSGRVREQGLGEDQVAEEPPSDSEVKVQEIFHCAKESKVSTIQIRKRAIKQEGNLTPMGLPKRVRLHKEDFSLEEIYTNKNYHTPTEKRKFETIFEEPVMKGGTLVLTSQRPLRRIMVFKNGGAGPRKRRRKGKGVGRSRRCTGSVGGNVDFELLLQHKMSQLEAALQEEEMAAL